MQRNLLLFLSLILAQMLVAQQLVIEVTTDKYPEETSWKLFDSNKDIIRTNGVLLKNSTHRDTIDLDPSLCYYWTIYDVYGDGMSNSDGPGSYTLYIDNSPVAICSNPNFGDSISVYGLGNGCRMYDAAIDQLTFNVTQSFTPFDLTFDMVNLGSVPVTSIELQYNINNNNPITTRLDFDPVNMGQKINLKVSEKIQVTEAGLSEIHCQILKVDDQTDQNEENNSLTKTIDVKNGYWRKPLYEQFTSSTCAPCAIANKVNVPTFAQYPGQFALIKYQVNFPGSGDPYYTAEVGYMRNGYEVNAVPTMFVDAVSIDPALTPDDFETYTGKITYGYLQVSAHLVGDSVFADVQVVASKDLSDPTFVRVAVVETETVGNVATNGEKKFENVFMKFVSNKQGTSTGYLDANKPVNMSFKSSLKNTNVEELNDLKLVVYLFYDNEYQIIQSEMIDIPYSPAPPYFAANITNNQTQVDTNIIININSDKAIDTTGLKSKILLYEVENPTNGVAFNISIDDSKTNLNIIPENPLKANKAYHLILSEIASTEGIIAPDFRLDFNTVESTGINTNELNDIRYYPNPFTDNLTVEVADDFKFLILDVSGKIMVEKLGKKGINQINTSDFPKGYYVLKISLNYNALVLPIIK